VAAACAVPSAGRRGDASGHGEERTISPPRFADMESSRAYGELAKLVHEIRRELERLQRRLNETGIAAKRSREFIRESKGQLDNIRRRAAWDVGKSTAASDAEASVAPNLTGRQTKA
jgi:hypothetical protein